MRKTKKLSLRHEVIAVLDARELRRVAGGRWTGDFCDPDFSNASCSCPPSIDDTCRSSAC